MAPSYASGLVEFALAYLLILAVPGANFMIVAEASALGRRGAGLAAALGIGCGAMVLALLALSGASTLATDPRAILIGKVWLAAVFLFIGFRALRRACFATAGRETGMRRSGSYFAAGTVTAVTNPVTAAFLLSSMIEGGRAANCSQAILLVPLVFVLASGWFAVVAMAFSSRRVRSAYGRWRGNVDLVLGALLASFGIMSVVKLAGH